MYVLYLKILMSTDLGSIEMVEPVEERESPVHGGEPNEKPQKIVLAAYYPGKERRIKD